MHRTTEFGALGEGRSPNRSEAMVGGLEGATHGGRVASSSRPASQLRGPRPTFGIESEAAVILGVAEPGRCGPDLFMGREATETNHYPSIPPCSLGDDRS